MPPSKPSPKSRKPTPAPSRVKALNEALRQAMIDSGLSGYALAKGSGLPGPVVSRFLRREEGREYLKGQSMEALCTFLALELRPTARTPRAR